MKHAKHLVNLLIVQKLLPREQQNSKIASSVTWYQETSKKTRPLTISRPGRNLLRVPAVTGLLFEKDTVGCLMSNK